MPKFPTQRRNVRHTPAAPTSHKTALDAFKEQIAEEKREAEQEVLTRGQRKRRDRRGRIRAKLNFGETLVKSKQASLNKSTRSFDTNALGLSLSEATEEAGSKAAPSGPLFRDRKRSLTHKRKQNIRRKETAQIQAVLGHPSFQANPTSTILQHLTNTIAVANAEAEE